MAGEKFVRCIDDGGDPISLTVGEFYESLPISATAHANNWIKVINNNREAQEYPVHLFDAVAAGAVVNQDRAAELLMLYQQGRLTPEEHTQLIEYTTQSGSSSTDPRQTEALTELARKLNIRPTNLLSS